MRYKIGVIVEFTRRLFKIKSINGKVMKQYDKAYVPNNLLQQETQYVLCEIAVPYPLVGLDEVKNVIVLTIEELREMWDAATRFGEDRILIQQGFDFSGLSKHQDLPEYLTSKGITLDK